MDIQISGRHMEITDTMEEKVRRYAQKLPHFDGSLMSLQVTLAVDKGEQSVELLAKSRHTSFVAKSNSRVVYECIDSAFKKLEKQIIRHNEKTKQHRVAEPAEERQTTEPESAD